MTHRSNDGDDDTPLGATELQALRRLAEPLTQLPPPETEELWASRYRILEPIGHGGMGDVSLARDVLLDRLVALKVLRHTSDESFVDVRRLLREARAAARAEHERIARVYDVGTWNGRAFIAMEYVRGQTLRVWMKTYRPTSAEVVAVVQQLLEGLSALHERGLVHRDLKPENVMVTPDGTLRILDLGIARRVAITDSTAGMGEPAGTLSVGFGVGTPGYMAPEQWRHAEVDARADLFALGVIAYELVAARAPFRGSTNLEIREETLHGRLSFDDPVWSEVPPLLRDAIRTALARPPEERFQSVVAMAEVLSPLFRPSLPPLSGSRTPSIRPPGDDKTRAESLAASVLTMAPAPSPITRPVGIALGGFAVLAVAGVLLRHHAAAQTPVMPGMVHIPGGSYAMGSDDAAAERMCATYPRGCPQEVRNEIPPRPVTVAPFEIDAREVTNEEFARFLTMIAASTRVVTEDEDYPRYVRYGLRSGDDFLLYDLWKTSRGVELTPAGTFAPRAGFEQLPATLVTWLGARLYCKSVAKRLPTEAEWELAAGGTAKRPFPWGAALPSCEGVHLPSDGTLRLDQPERCENTRTVPFPVATAPQDVTPDGVYDLAGNVVEWVDDDDRLDTDEQKYTSRLQSETPGVVRGGAYNSSFLARVTSRNFRLPFNAGANLGFRCAKSIVPSR